VNRTGTVDLEHHAVYLSPKRLHYVMFLVNETRGRDLRMHERIDTWLGPPVSGAMRA
jgi:hypothetical protein